MNKFIITAMAGSGGSKGGNKIGGSTIVGKTGLSATVRGNRPKAKGPFKPGAVNRETAGKAYTKGAPKTRFKSGQKMGIARKPKK